MLDLNELAQGPRRSLSVGGTRRERRWQSDWRSRIDTTGYRQYTLRVKDLRNRFFCWPTALNVSTTSPGPPTTRRSST